VRAPWRTPKIAEIAGGFVLTRQEAAGKWCAMTYAVIMGQRFRRNAQELRECSATLERAFADVERADLGPGLFDDFAFLIDLLVAQSAFGAAGGRSGLPRRPDALLGTARQDLPPTAHLVPAVDDRFHNSTNPRGFLRWHPHPRRCGSARRKRSRRIIKLSETQPGKA
jgi:hypothetical protein